MLRTRLKRQLIALAVGTLMAALLTLWSGWATHRASVTQTLISDLRNAAQELEISIHQQTFHLLDYSNEAAPAVLRSLQLHTQTADRSLARLLNAESVLGPQAVTDLKRAHAQHTAAMGEVVSLTRLRHALSGEVTTPPDRVDAKPANQTSIAERQIGTLARESLAELEQLKEAKAELDRVLDERVQANLESRHYTARIEQERAFGGAVASVVLLLLVLTASGMVMFGVKQRLKSGLRPLLQLSERIGAGDLTSRVEPSPAVDEFQQLTHGFLQMRTQLRERTVTLDRLDAILDRLGSLRILVGSDGIIREASAAALRMLGYEAAQLEGTPVTRLLGQELDFFTLRQLIRQRLLHEQAWSFSDAAGRSVPVIMTGVQLTDDLLLLLGTPVDAASSQSMWSHAAEGLLIVDAEGKIRQANPAALRMLGTTDSVLRRCTLQQVCEQAGCDRRMDAEILAELAQSPEVIELSLTQAGHWTTYLQARVARLEIAGDEPMQFALTLRDLTELYHAQEEIRRLAYYDPLTGLTNRSRFQQHLEEAIKSAVRRGERLALLYLDLDNFKYVNDRFGHEQGDRLLKEVGYRLKREVRETEVVSRLGGDEFCLLLVDVDDEGRAAAQMAQRCLDVLSSPLYLEGTAVSVLGSIGIAIYPTDAAEPYELLRAADMAMYEAKSAGKHDYAFYDARMTEAVNERLANEAALRVAVSRGELELHYQPQVSLSNGRMVGVEALVRWRRPGTGLVAPDEFISLAEQIGVIGEIGGWVLETACRQAVAWQREGLPPMLMAVNISSRHFEAPAFVESVARVLRDSGIAPEQLEIEITESLTRDPERHALICRALQEQGVRVAIDDFGIGYSSLSVLTQMPINTMKLDRQFVHNLTIDERAVVMTGTVISMAAGLHFGVVAEGVETHEQLQVLTGLGCTIAQGYYFCRPLPGDQIPAFTHRDFRVHSAEGAGMALMEVEPIRAAEISRH
jgi:diguanylate cyclase (GGDEF)-like protein/PAS domain S-box-containing protein